MHVKEEKTLKCSHGLHRWTTDAGRVVSCFRCGKERAIGKTMRCRIGMHRWIKKADDGGSRIALATIYSGPYRECFFCREYGGMPRPEGGVNV